MSLLVRDVMTAPVKAQPSTLVVKDQAMRNKKLVGIVTGTDVVDLVLRLLSDPRRAR